MSYDVVVVGACTAGFMVLLTLIPLYFAAKESNKRLGR